VDPREFEEFFLQVYPQLVRYAQWGRGSAVAEDLAAKTMEQIWLNGEAAPVDEYSFHRLRKFSFAILRRHIGHQVRDEAALRRREHSFSREQAMRPSSTESADNVATAGWPAWAAGLREEERKLLGLHVNGYKPSEIAKIIGIRPSAVSARLQRAKGKARRLWRDGGHDSG